MIHAVSRRLLAIVFAATAFVANVHAEDFRVGFVNTDRIMREATSAKAAQAKLEQEFSKREKDLNDLSNALKAATDKFDREVPTLSEAQRATRQKALIDQEREFQREAREIAAEAAYEERCRASGEPYGSY